MRCTAALCTCLLASTNRMGRTHDRLELSITRASRGILSTRRHLKLEMSRARDALRSLTVSHTLISQACHKHPHSPCVTGESHAIPLAEYGSFSLIRQGRSPAIPLA